MTQITTRHAGYTKLSYRNMTIVELAKSFLMDKKNVGKVLGTTKRYEVSTITQEGVVIGKHPGMSEDTYIVNGNSMLSCVKKTTPIDTAGKYPYSVIKWILQGFLRWLI